MSLRRERAGAGDRLPGLPAHHSHAGLGADGRRVRMTASRSRKCCPAWRTCSMPRRRAGSSHWGSAPDDRITLSQWCRRMQEAAFEGSGAGDCRQRARGRGRAAQRPAQRRDRLGPGPGPAGSRRRLDGHAALLAGMGRLRHQRRRRSQRPAAHPGLRAGDRRAGDPDRLDRPGRADRSPQVRGPAGLPPGDGQLRPGQGGAGPLRVCRRTARRPGAGVSRRPWKPSAAASS